MSKWTPASSPPKQDGVYLIWVKLGGRRTYLALAYWATTVRYWIEIFQGGFDRVLDDEIVHYWQPAPKSPEDQAEQGV